MDRDGHQGMTRRQRVPGFERIQAREDGMRRVRGVTTWVTAGAAALAVTFGGAFAASRTLGTSHGSQSGSGTGSQGSGDNSGGGDDQNANQPANPNSGGFQAPVQLPGFGGGGGSHAQSGGS